MLKEYGKEVHGGEAVHGGSATILRNMDVAGHEEFGGGQFMT